MRNTFKKPNDTTSSYILKLAGMGLLFTAASILAPQLPYFALRALIKKKFGKDYSDRQVGNSVGYLKRKQFIALERKKGKIETVLTKLGHKHLKRLSLNEISIKPTSWDGQWRLLTFDIPESHSSARHIFRRKLKELGFFHFQRSVFILPYDCEKEINTITKILGLHYYVHVLTARRFPSDRPLLKNFGLN